MLGMPSWPTLAVVDAVREDLPGGLVTDVNLERVRSVATLLGNVTSSCYLEVRLDDDPQVDYLVLLEDRHRAYEIFEQQIYTRGSPSGSRSLSFLGAWAGGDACEILPFA